MTEHTCPICEKICGAPDKLFSSGRRYFICYCPLENNPLHHYNSCVNEHGVIEFQKFSIELNNKFALVTVDYTNNNTAVQFENEGNKFYIDCLIVPDFPELVNFKRHIQTAIVFG